MKQGEVRTFERLEALRGVAALAVLWHHSPFIDGARAPLAEVGYLFVDFFFVLSGFVMTHAYAARIADGLGFRTFLVRRLARLYPLHLLTLLLWGGYVLAKIAAAAALELQDEDPLHGQTVASFAANLLLLHAAGATDGLTWNYPSWSVSAETAAYLLFFAASAALGRRARWLFVAAVVIGYSYLFFGRDGPDRMIPTYDWGWLRCIAGFSVGALIYGVRNVASVRANPLADTAIEAALATALIAALLRADGAPGWQLVTVVGFAAATLIFSRPSEGAISRALRQAPCVALGAASYAVYMLHAVILAAAGNVARFVLGLPATADGKVDHVAADAITAALAVVIVLLAHQTYRRFERPVQSRINRRFG